MAEALTLTAEKRDPAVKANHARAEGKIPAVLYGHKQENQPVACNDREFHKVYVKAGESTIVELEVGKKRVPVLIHEIQLDPVSGAYTHVDFFAPDMTKEVTTRVPIRTVGVSPAVKDQGGILVRNFDHLTMKCLPKDLPHEIEVDVSVLLNFFEHVTVEKIALPKGVHVMEDVKTIVVSVIPPRKEEEELLPPTAAVVEGAEVAGDAAATAEGEAPAKEDAGKKEGKKEPKSKKE